MTLIHMVSISILLECCSQISHYTVSKKFRSNKNELNKKGFFLFSTTKEIDGLNETDLELLELFLDLRGHQDNLVD